MSIPTVPVTVTLRSADGTACPDGTVVTATLDIMEVYQGFIASGRVQAATVAGVAVLQCFPNNPQTGLGSSGSVWTFSANWVGARKPLRERAQVPNAACALDAIRIIDEPLAPLTDAQAAVASAQAYAAAASAAGASGASAVVSAAVAAHVAATDPHPVYTTAAEAAAAAPVQSVAGRTGAVTLAKADVGLANVDNTADAAKPISTATQTALDGKQPLDAELTALAGLTSAANKVPVFTGVGAATTFDFDTDGTLAANSNSRIPSQQAVKTYADQLLAANDALVFKGVVDCSANPNYPAASAGNTYRVSVAGKIGGAPGVNVEAGDLLICLVDGTAAGTQAAVGANWTITQANLDGAVIGPASAVAGNVAAFNGTSGKLVQDSGKALPAGLIVGDTDAQTLTNKTLTAPTLTAPTINGGALTGLTSFSLANAGTGAFNAIVAYNGTLTADRTLTLNLNNLARSISLAGNLVFGAGFSTGVNPIVFATPTTVSVTLPATGTLATLHEIVTVAGALTGTVNVDLSTAAIEYHNVDATANWIFNFRGNSTTTLDTLLSVGQSRMVQVFAQQGATPRFPTAFTVDGSAVAPKWVGAAAPAAGNANSTDLYTFRIIKTAAATFSIFAEQSRYA